MKPFLMPFIAITLLFFTADLLASEIPQPVDSDPDQAAGERPSKDNRAAPPDSKDNTPAKRFVPREKVRADDAVSFPVDI